MFCCDSPGYYLGCLSLWPFFFLFHLFLLPLTGDRRGPLLQCHLSDQDRGRPAAVFSEPHYRRAGCAADAGFWGPGSFGHWDLLQFPGWGCRPRRAHASGTGNCHGPHHGRSPWISHQHSSFLFSSVTCREHRITVSCCILVLLNWWADYNINYSSSCFCYAAHVFFVKHTSCLRYTPLTNWSWMSTFFKYLLQCLCQFYNTSFSMTVILPAIV